MTRATTARRCLADAPDATVTYMRCPACGSEACACQASATHHEHVCFACPFTASLPPADGDPANKEAPLCPC